MEIGHAIGMHQIACNLGEVSVWLTKPVFSGLMEICVLHAILDISPFHLNKPVFLGAMEICLP